MVKRVTKKAKETAGIWIERINAFERLADEARREREKFSLAMSLRFRHNPVLDSLDEETRSLLREATHDVPYLFRYAQWLKSQTTGDRPFIDYPQDDGTEFADFASTLLTRVLADETGTMEEWRSGMTTLASFGVEAFWYGFHADVVSREIAKAAGESPSDVVNRMAEGDTQPKEGQNHELLAQVAGGAAADPDAAQELPLEVHANVMEGAVNQRAAADEEDTLEQPVGVLGHRVWCRREPVGLKTSWSADVSNKHDIWWMARKILLSVPVAQNTSAFNASRKKLQGEPMREEDGYHPIDSTTLPEFEHENKRVVVYEIWDKRFQTRHYVSPELKEFLEVDEDNPYVDEDGRGVIPGFFPCVVSRPLEPDDEGPRRLLGLPLIAPAWDQQREYNEMRSLAISAARRHSIRQYLVHPMIGGDASFIEALESGEDGAVIKAPDGIDPSEFHKAIVPLAFSHPPQDLDAQANRILQDMSASLAWPMASMLGQSVTPTATQEQIGVAAGNAQADDILASIEKDFARGVEIIRGLVRAFYPVEKISALVGPEYAKILEAWRQDSLDGDRLSVRFGARAAAEDKVQIKQKFDLLQVLMSIMDPMLPGAQAFDVRPLVKSIARDLNEKEPDEFDDRTKQVMQLVQEALSARQQQAEAQQSVDKSNAREAAKESTNANETAAAQRVRDF